MKKRTLFFVAVFTFLTTTIFAQTLIAPHFDEGVDLVSAVFRLAGAKEYNKCLIEHYGESFDEYFAEYKNHSAVRYAQIYYNNFGIGYDAVASYGTHLIINDDGFISFNPNIDEKSDNSFNRWTDQQKRDFLIKLNDFYRESNFHQWYESTSETRTAAEQAFQSLYQSIDFHWYGNFFEKRDDAQFGIILSILVGPENYGCNYKLKNGNTIMTPVIGCCRLNSDGNIEFTANTVLPIIIHEYCHAYCNPLNAENWKSMQNLAKKVYKSVEQQMKMMAYGNPVIMMDETFVRASVIRYLINHFPNMSDKMLIQNETQQGFILTGTLVESLAKYEQQRTRYQNIKDYMPQLIKDINHFDIKKYEKQKKDAAKHNATYTVSIKDGESNVPSGEYTIIISFSKPMVEGITLGYGREGTQFLKAKAYEWNEEKTQLSLLVINEPHTLYGFNVMGEKFHTQDGYTAGETRYFNYTTGD